MVKFYNCLGCDKEPITVKREPWLCVSCIMHPLEGEAEDLRQEYLDRYNEHGVDAKSGRNR